MSNVNQDAKAQGIAAIKAEISRHNPISFSEVDDLVAGRLRLDSLGVPFIVNKDGTRDDYQSLEQFMSAVVRDNPHMFQNSRPSSTGGTSSARSDNPFMKGHSFNISRQMLLINTNRPEAEKLARAANVKI